MVYSHLLHAIPTLIQLVELLIIPDPIWQILDYGYQNQKLDFLDSE